MSTETQDNQTAASRTEEPKAGRLLSLDAFRGLTIGLMLLVNNIALDTATPKQLTHAPWNAGLRLADFVFPWFLFCVGAAIPFASASFKRKGMPLWRYDLKAAGRALTLVALGCLIDSSLYKQPIFDLGVLQLIGLAYLVGAVLYELPFYGRMAIAALLLVGYWALIKFTNVPGAGVGVFEETRNIIAHVNLTYLSSMHLAGLLSVIPTAAMVLIGTAIGDLLRREDRTPVHKVAVMLIAGVALMLGGFLWSLHLPFNKPVWTPSYILFTAGAGSVALGVLYLIIDARAWRAWAFPLVVFGSNAILAYVAPILVKVHALQEWSVAAAGKSVSVQQWWLDSFKARFGPIPGGWLYSASYIAVWWIVLFVFYRKKIFLRV